MYASMSHGRRAIAYPRGRISYLPNVGSRPGRHVYPEHFGWSNSSRYTPSRDALNIDALFNLFEYGNVPAREPNATRPSSTTTPASELRMRGDEFGKMKDSRLSRSLTCDRCSCESRLGQGARLKGAAGAVCKAPSRGPH
ncbi:hypothetical protein C0Q70_19342 [Pomacea canaliculata]|uniref:Uncharacterized protein n=1 Tax=Pomacea canaliculata TaxID=400727 RepID=A0A2T7NJ42_POMCA|nr:hypothetical protein C0Q70_19342 [Pomacea canaliculata]